MQTVSEQEFYDFIKKSMQLRMDSKLMVLSSKRNGLLEIKKSLGSHETVSAMSMRFWRLDKLEPFCYTECMKSKGTH